MTNNSTAAKGLYRRRGSPHWWIRYADQNGRIYRRSTGTVSKKLAREILAKHKVLVAEGRHLDVKKVPKTTFFELCNEYWELEGKYKRMSSLQYMVKAWRAFFGNVAIKELTQQRIEKFLNDLIEIRGLGASGRNRHLTMLKALFNKGIQWGLVGQNPCRSISRLREPGPRTRFLNHEEIQKLVESASKEFHPVLITALHTGMRRGEILNLKWNDVDLENRIVTVQDSKSGKKRMIPMDDTLYETLRILPSRFQRGYVFPSSVNRGKPRYDFKRQFHNALENAEIEDLRFHDLRHTFASHLVMAGVDIKTVQELLGHATLTMTMRYTHLASDHRTRAIKALDKALQTDTKTDTVGNSESKQSR